MHYGEQLASFETCESIPTVVSEPGFNTRPDLSYSIELLSRFMQDPKDHHLKAVKQKQPIVALSSCESEFMAATGAASIALVRNPVFHGRSMHIDIRYHFIRECVENGHINVEHVSGELQREDILTKALPRLKVGEAFVETNEGRIKISNVLFTPEVTLNILSIDQLEEQGYMVNYVNNRCRIKYMFDEMPEAVEQEATIEGEDEDSIFKSHNSFLDDYFRSLDLNEECSLVKGMEDLKMNKEDVHDYVDNEYLSLNGTLYAMKVNTFQGLYKFVDAMGGYMNVTFNNKWYQVAKFLGLAYEHHETVKEVDKEYIGMVKVYYEEAKRSRHGEPRDVAVNCRGTAGRERPQVLGVEQKCQSLVAYHPLQNHQQLYAFWLWGVQSIAIEQRSSDRKMLLALGIAMAGVMGQLGFVGT
nr:ribonuclease H-like domain, reverse transcriptase, RNA-dependent DNA polymerase [Tanacetum cinerariifolium]